MADPTAVTEDNHRLETPSLRGGVTVGVAPTPAQLVLRASISVVWIDTNGKKSGSR